ncbi:DNA/RNA non-specific endonuclease [Microbacterium sp. KUDC0406]|uniref:DNA/RNA non-specific endonuclease n=1 Tax=Microbacterium sp. KUDC0406 TaxID=2909588 RepID=UPI002E342FA2|nr:DNA/RNA non-specific endonuclease [Microbacterium sp. KUDC0406]
MRRPRICASRSSPARCWATTTRRTVGIRIPLRFWKVAAWCDDDVLACAGFVLDQSELVDTAEGRLTVPPLGAFRTFQMPVSAIDDMTGIDFGALVDADVLSGRAARGEAWPELTEPGDIVL